MKNCQEKIAIVVLCVSCVVGVNSFADEPAAEPAAAPKALSCDALKQKIEDKFQSKGVKNYKLDVINKDESTSAKIVGSCDGGKHKIAYSKQDAAAATN